MAISSSLPSARRRLRLKAEGPHAIEGRGIGLADMATRLQMVGRQHCNDELGYHVLMRCAAVLESAESGTAIVQVRSSGQQVRALLDDSTLEKREGEDKPGHGRR